MASKAGPRAAGTDGSDFWHRESVAWQYKISSINKWRLKFDLTLQLMIACWMFVRLLPALTAFLGLPWFQRLRHWDVPAPRAWEYAWMCSALAAVLGWKSLAKNQIQLLKQFMIGTVVFGILPVVYGIIDQSDDLLLYLQERKYSVQILGYPAVLVWFAFLAIAVQIHGFGIYFSAQLLRSWKPRGDKKLN